MTLTPEKKKELFWFMLLSRRLDECAWRLHHEGKITYHISAIGHEAAQAAAAFSLQKGQDWVAPYYRDLTLLLALGLAPRDFLLGLMGKQGDPASGGRQLPGSWGLRSANVISVTSLAAGHMPHAVGVAHAMKLRGSAQVVLAACGEGATSLGDWYEAANWAAVHKLPVVFLVENNHYAISTRQEKQMAVKNVSEKAAGLGMPGVTVNGNDWQTVYHAVRQAVEAARRGDGPALVEAEVNRIPPHSSDDDDRTYRTRQEVEGYEALDPLAHTRLVLENEGVLTTAMLREMEAKVKTLVEDAVRDAEEAPYPPAVDSPFPVFAEDSRHA
jgi:2-oxoisovalerate dehydrogenase E1 component alpha subunit